jgi:hypothetical protein
MVVHILYFAENLSIIREYIKDESIDLIYFDISSSFSII